MKTNQRFVAVKLARDFIIILYLYNVTRLIIYNQFIQLIIADLHSKLNNHSTTQLDSGNSESALPMFAVGCLFEFHLKVLQYSVSPRPVSLSGEQSAHQLRQWSDDECECGLASVYQLAASSLRAAHLSRC